MTAPRFVQRMPLVAQLTLLGALAAACEVPPTDIGIRRIDAADQLDNEGTDGTVEPDDDNDADPQLVALAHLLPGKSVVIEPSPATGAGAGSSICVSFTSAAPVIAPDLGIYELRCAAYASATESVDGACRLDRSVAPSGNNILGLTCISDAGGACIPGTPSDELVRLTTTEDLSRLDEDGGVEGQVLTDTTNPALKATLHADQTHCADPSL
jgi:hypothetical protein